MQIRRHNLAQYTVVRALSRGEGVAKDDAKSLEWFLKAEKGYVKSHAGNETNLDWFLKTDEQGETNSQHNEIPKQQLRNGF